MGYTHYWDRKKEIDKPVFDMIVQDFKKVLPVLSELGVELAGWDGKGKPKINRNIISFNGVENCGHHERNLGITWPAKNASGISCMTEINSAQNENTLLTKLSGRQESLSVNDSDIGGKWFAGLKLNQRTCGGDCSHESFLLERKYKPADRKKSENGKYFVCCKTAYKPYDLAVNVCLIIAKNYLGNQIEVRSDGRIEHWKDAMVICQKILGYGAEFKLGE